MKLAFVLPLLLNFFAFYRKGGVGHSQQAALRDELASDTADAVGLVLDAHESGL